MVPPFPWIDVAIILALVALNGVFSMSELAIVSARTARLGWQLARLALTYGEDRVRRVVIADPEAPLPEDRWSWQGVALDGEAVP